MATAFIFIASAFHCLSAPGHIRMSEGNVEYRIMNNELRNSKFSVQCSIFFEMDVNTPLPQYHGRQIKPAFGGLGRIIDAADLALWYGRNGTS